MSSYLLHPTALVKVGLLLLSMILAAFVSPVKSSQSTWLFSTPHRARGDEVRRSAIGLLLADDRSKPGYRSKSVWLVDDLRNDMFYLFGEPDFCAVVGMLAICPRVFDSAFKNESPEFTEMWGVSYFADQFFEFGESMGSAVLPLSASVICYSIGKVRHLSTAESFGRDLLCAQAINGLLTLSLKGVINRTRPDGTHYGYPSGHTSTAFTSAGVIHHYFGTIWGLSAYLTATYVGLSRLQENKHYLTDVIAGAILGSYVAYKVTHKREKASGHSISPFLTDKMFGARLAINF
jgi:membrane-associated phospholipid phosphatase